MTDVLGRWAPPVEFDRVRRLTDFGIDLMIDHAIAVLLEPRESGRQPRALRERIAETPNAAAYVDLLDGLGKLSQRFARHGTDWAAMTALLPAPGADFELGRSMEPWFQAVTADALRVLGDKEYKPRLRLGLQLLPIALHLGKLSFARQALRHLLDPERPVRIAAPLVPALGRPASGTGGIDVFAIIDPTDPFTYQALPAARTALARFGEGIRWHWIHGPGYQSTHTFAACCVVQAAIEAAPEVLWSNADLLLRQVAAFRLGMFEDALRLSGWPIDPSAAVARAATDAVQDRVWRDAAMLDAFGVPGVRPTFVVGRRVFAGDGTILALNSAVARAVRHGGAD
ncbi:MAG TPA: hypothetical protein VGM88_31455 [Kofleriaceae bacterium]|jgi:hypothetical protein